MHDVQFGDHPEAFESSEFIQYGYVFYILTLLSLYKFYLPKNVLTAQSRHPNP